MANVDKDADRQEVPWLSTALTGYIKYRKCAAVHRPVKTVFAVYLGQTCPPMNVSLNNSPEAFQMFESISCGHLIHLPLLDEQAVRTT